MGLETNDDGDVLIVRLPGVLNQEFADAVKAGAEELVAKGKKLVALDARAVHSIDKSSYQAVIYLKQLLKKKSIPLCTYGMKPDLIKLASQDGLDQSFQFVTDLKDAKQKAGIPTDGVDVHFINPFLRGTIETLKVQAQTEVKAEKPYVKTQPTENIGIAGVLTLVSDLFSGSITLCFPAEVFLGVYNRMFSEDNTEITPEIEDCAGELLNIIYGQAKAELNDRSGFQLKKAIPTVLTGSKLSVRQTGNGKTVVVPFVTDLGRFYFEIEFERN